MHRCIGMLINIRHLHWPANETSMECKNIFRDHT
jgi:hypothetical protein